MPEQRRPTPLGVAIPPKKPGDSMPPDERVRHEMLASEERLGHKIDQLRAETLAKVQDLEERVVAVEDSTREAKDAATCSRRTEALVTELATDVRAVLRKDVDHEARIGALEKEAIAKGESAGRGAGTKWGVLAGGIGTVLAVVIEWLMTH